MFAYKRVKSIFEVKTRKQRVTTEERIERKLCSDEHLPLLYHIIGGFLKMVLSTGWFSIKLHLCIFVFLKFLTPRWYVATNGNICSWVFFFCFKADCLPAKETSDNILSNKCLGYPLARRRVLKLERDSWNFFSAKFVRRSLIASPLINLFWHLVGDRKCNVCIEMFQSVYSEFLCQG